MKIIPLLVAIVLLVPTLRGEVRSQVAVDEAFSQVGPHRLQLVHIRLTGQVFVSPGDFGDLDTVDSVRLFAPDRHEVPGFRYDYENETLFNFQEHSATLRQVGGRYVYRFSGGTLDGMTRSIRLDAGMIAKAYPKLSARSFRALSSRPTSQPIRLVFRQFRIQPSATVAATLILIRDADFETVLNLPVENGKSIATVPANTLQPGAAYSFTLWMIRFGPDTNGDGFWDTFYSVSNSFDFKAAPASAGVRSRTEDPLDSEEQSFVQGLAE